jgi:hypothetical protein
MAKKLTRSDVKERGAVLEVHAEVVPGGVDRFAVKFAPPDQTKPIAEALNGLATMALSGIRHPHDG